MLGAFQFSARGEAIKMVLDADGNVASSSESTATSESAAEAVVAKGSGND